LCEGAESTVRVVHATTIVAAGFTCSGAPRAPGINPCNNTRMNDMCASGEEPTDGAQGSIAPASLGAPDMVVTAARIGINMDIFQQIDWGEVGRLTALGVGFGAASTGTLGGAIFAGAGAAATGVEGQPGVNLTDLFEIKNDMLLINGLPSNLPLY
jgi:hypothetical protein